MHASHIIGRVISSGEYVRGVHVCPRLAVSDASLGHVCPQVIRTSYVKVYTRPN